MASSAPLGRTAGAVILTHRLLRKDGCHVRLADRTNAARRGQSQPVAETGPIASALRAGVQVRKDAQPGGIAASGLNGPHPTEALPGGADLRGPSIRQ
jgi:hypothetical protein